MEHSDQEFSSKEFNLKFMGFGIWLGDFTKEFDIFGRVVSLYVARSLNHRTTTGGLFSFLLVLVIFAYGYTAFLPLYYKTNPTYTLTSAFYQDPGQLHTTTPDLYFTVNISSAVLHNFNPATAPYYFTIKFLQHVCPAFADECLIIDLGIQPCSLDFFNTYPRMMDFANTSYCPTSKDYNLSGEPLGDYYQGKSSSYIEIQVSACINTTNYTCATPEQINTVLEDPDLEVFVFFANNYVVITDYEDPIKRVVGYAGGRIAPNDLELIFTEYLDQIDIVSNDGPVQANWTTNSSYYVNPLSQSIATADPTTKAHYFKLIFRRSQQGQIYKRQFLTLATCLSDIGGFSLTMMSAFGFILFAYAELKYKIYFSNQMYRFSQKQRMALFNNNASIELPLLQPGTVNLEDTNTTQRFSGNAKIGRYLAIKAHPDYYREGKLIVNLKDFLIYNYTFGLLKNPQTEKISRAEAKIAKDSDIIDMARLCKHIEKLKNFTLEPDQKIIFNSFKDPFVLVEDEEPEAEVTKYKEAFKEKSEFVGELKFEEIEKCGRIYTAYIRLSKKLDDPRNQKIIEQLDRDMIEFFEDVKEIIDEDFDQLPQVFAESLLAFKSKEGK